MSSSVDETWGTATSILWVYYEVSNILILFCCRCDMFSNILMVHSLCGGTGGGLGSRLLETLRGEFRLENIISCVVAPFISGDTPLQHYNALLSLTSLQKWVPLSVTVGSTVSEIGAVVKVVDSHLCGWGSIPGKSCSVLIVFLSKSLSTVLHVFWSACKIPDASWVFLGEQFAIGLPR